MATKERASPWGGEASALTSCAATSRIAVITIKLRTVKNFPLFDPAGILEPPRSIIDAALLKKIFTEQVICHTELNVISVCYGVK